MPIRIKICGLTSLADARAAAQAGADYLGFILYPNSPRYIEPERITGILAELAQAGFTTPGVGVFVNMPVPQVRAVLDQTGLRFAQLHGDEPAADVSTLAPRAFKAIRPSTVAAALLAAQEYHLATWDRGPGLLVDAYDANAYGGTGKRTDEQIASRLARHYTHLLLAGGLSPANVAQAIRDVQPWGVDASSSLESAPGRKDHAAIERFVAAAREA